MILKLGDDPCMIFEVFSNWLLVSTSGKVLLMFCTLKKWKWIGMLLSNWALNSSRCWWGLLGTQKSTPQWFGMRIMRWCNSFCSNMSWTLGPHLLFSFFTFQHTWELDSHTSLFFLFFFFFLHVKYIQEPLYSIANVDMEQHFLRELDSTKVFGASLF